MQAHDKRELTPYPPGTLARARPATPHPALAPWLLTICGMIWAMIVLGGATRATGSGLSITEWRPLTGVLPPMTQAEWLRLFHAYQRIPQYRLLNEGFGLEGFQRIFWLEWLHRLWGRLIGVAFALPLLWFAWRGRIPRLLLPRLALLLILGGLQGAVGWWMVRSGFQADRVAVSAYRLVAHLSMALLLYAAILWTALDLRGKPRAAAPLGLRLASTGLCAAVALTIVAGGFMAGTHAGMTYNSFPRMDGQWFPDGYFAMTLPRGWFENVTAVQFDHRVLATLSLTGAVGLAAWAWRRGVARGWAIGLAATTGAQYALGVMTLLWVVPPALAVMHQAVAVGVLTAALGMRHALGRRR